MSATVSTDSIQRRERRAGGGAAIRSRPQIEGEAPRPSVRGKSIYLGEKKLAVRGVTYGPLGSGPGGGFEPDSAATDFQAMVAAGINAIRLYAPPPRWLLDLAHEHGLMAMVGVAWEQHVTFLDLGRTSGIERTVRESVRACAGHPAVLCYAIGNEIPASIVRWHGRRRVERFLAQLCRVAREEDPGGLVTYINYPSTEYLRLPECDLMAFNVYLERRELLERYLGRLQNLADDRPLLLAEVGLDSRRTGVDRQAAALRWQIECALESGCAGLFVFSWTDRWHRGGHDITDWDFGLTTRERAPKPALAVVREAFAIPPRWPTPRISVVVCTYNGAATLRQCLEGVLALRYPDYEVVVVSDGSTDGSAAIASAYPAARVIETPNHGLSAARNAGLEMATGDVVAYLDDDAVPDPDWLSHIASALADSSYAAVGGPNVAPPDSGARAQCVANAPGGPTHVLISDREAEHIPGCNMAVRRDDLLRVGGFDPRFRVAGDDVDLCWRLLDSGRRIAFSPGAVVLHRRRATVRGYLRQQRGYGRAEALLERKHPERYTAAGHVEWTGRLYGGGAAQHRGGWRWRVYYGGWGTAFYQSIYGPRRGLLESLPLMPEWYLAIAVLTAATAAGALWRPLFAAAPLLAAAFGALLVDAGLGAARARFSDPAGSFALRALTALLYLLQPVARLSGRLGSGLTPWRRRGPRAFMAPWPRAAAVWSERWRSIEERIRAITEALGERGAVVRSGGDWDRWDLHVRGGLLGAARLIMAIEEHGSGRQMMRVRFWPRLAPSVLALITLLGSAAVGALLTRAGTAAAVLAALALIVLLRALYESGRGIAAVHRAVCGIAAFETHESSQTEVPAPVAPDPTVRG
jgi:GT2 family glycosyltransferase